MVNRVKQQVPIPNLKKRFLNLLAQLANIAFARFANGQFLILEKNVGRPKCQKSYSSWCQEWKIDGSAGYLKTVWIWTFFAIFKCRTAQKKTRRKIMKNYESSGEKLLEFSRNFGANKNCNWNFTSAINSFDMNHFIDFSYWYLSSNYCVKFYLYCGNLSWSTNKFLRNIVLCTWILSFIYWKPNAKDTLRTSLL